MAERRGSGGKTVSKYSWLTDKGPHQFVMIWHSSVSDRNYAQKVIVDVKKKLSDVPGLSLERSKGKSAIAVYSESAAEYAGRFSLQTPSPEIFLVRHFIRFLNAINASMDFERSPSRLQRLVNRLDAKVHFRTAYRAFKKGWYW